MKTVMNKQVMNYQTDSFGIVHHARYLEMMEEARWLYCYENELMDPYHERGIIHVIVNINIDYQNSARIGDELDIQTELLRVTEKSVVFRQAVYRKEKLLVQADLTNVYLNQSDHSTIKAADMIDFWPELKMAIDKKC